MPRKEALKPNRLKSALRKVPVKKPRKNSRPDRIQLIQAKAYELYEQRGRSDGDDWRDWFEAEKVIGLD